MNKIIEQKNGLLIVYFNNTLFSNTNLPKLNNATKGQNRPLTIGYTPTTYSGVGPAGLRLPCWAAVTQWTHDLKQRSSPQKSKNYSTHRQHTTPPKLHQNSKGKKKAKKLALPPITPPRCCTNFRFFSFTSPLSLSLKKKRAQILPPPFSFLLLPFPISFPFPPSFRLFPCVARAQPCCSDKHFLQFSSAAEVNCLRVFGYCLCFGDGPLRTLPIVRTLQFVRENTCPARDCARRKPALLALCFSLLECQILRLNYWFLLRGI